ncbi:MAG TPA: putative molybdenum carrier protein [Hyphomicrobiaceae bacterium]|nr:putative molybdenum carrier protein [Hyphomicrobiaceae bacterium]
MAAMVAPGVMKIVSGGQTGVDRAALDVAIERGMEWGGWCPSGGWAEDFPDPPGVLAHYPHLKETPLSNPVQRTEWNVRDSDASLIITDSTGEGVSIGTRRAHESAYHYGKPVLVVDATDPQAPARATAWLGAQRKRFGASMTLSIGGPRESEAPGIYARAKPLIAAILDRADATGHSDRN